MGRYRAYQVIDKTYQDNTINRKESLDNLKRCANINTSTTKPLKGFNHETIYNDIKAGTINRWFAR